MKNSELESQLAEIAKIVKEKVFIPQNQRKVTVFLCGADIDDASSGRYGMAAILASVPRYQILYPEDLFDDLLAGQGQYSLLELENILAGAVDAIILFPESPKNLYTSLFFSWLTHSLSVKTPGNTDLFFIPK